jgi:peroxiredoxin-like protein
MQALPHQYHVQAKAQAESNLQVHASNLTDLTVAPPTQFGGPGDQWSPEDLLMASVASCFILSFRAIARASNFSWLSLECNTQGELDKLAGITQFTKIVIMAKLVIGNDESSEKAERLLNKAEQLCLITNSLSSESHLECEISVEAN